MNLCRPKKRIPRKKGFDGNSQNNNNKKTFRRSKASYPERPETGWPPLTAETEVNEDSKSSNERGPSLVGLLIEPVQDNFILPWLLWSALERPNKGYVTYEEVQCQEFLSGKVRVGLI